MRWIRLVPALLMAALALAPLAEARKGSPVLDDPPGPAHGHGKPAVDAGPPEQGGPKFRMTRGAPSLDLVGVAEPAPSAAPPVAHSASAPEPAPPPAAPETPTSAPDAQEPIAAKAIVEPPPTAAPDAPPPAVERHPAVRQGATQGPMETLGAEPETAPNHALTPETAPAPTPTWVIPAAQGQVPRAPTAGADAPTEGPMQESELSPQRPALTPSSPNAIQVGPLLGPSALWGAAALGTVGLGAFALRGPATLRNRGRPAAPSSAAPELPGASLQQRILAQSPGLMEQAPQLEGLIREAYERPWDGEAQFGLALALFDQDVPEPALRHLELAYRLQPLTILRTLKDPELAALAEREDVRRILQRFHQEHRRRAWAGYA